MLAEAGRRRAPRAPPSAGAISSAVSIGPRVVAGVQHDVGQLAGLGAGGRPSRSHCAAAEVGQPGARARAADRAVHAGHRLAVADQHQPGRRQLRRTSIARPPSPSRTFRSEARARRRAPRRVAAVAPGPSTDPPIHGAIPRRRPPRRRHRAPARPSLGLAARRRRRRRRPGLRRGRPRRRRRSTALGAFLADPLLQTGTWDVPPDGAGDRDHAAPRRHRRRRRRRASTPPRQLGVAVRRRGDRTAHRVPGRHRRRRRRRPPAPPRRQPDHRALVGRPGRRPMLHPGSDDVRRPSRSIAVRGLDDDGLGRARRRAVARPRPRGAGGHPRPLRGRRAATRPTSSWRRWPRRGASTAPTRRSGRPSRPTTARRCRRCSTSCAAATDAVDAPFVRSAFVGNAGIVSFAPGTTIALKAETHNHPSAVEPFGGANTGVGGVIRDVLGAAHRPIAVHRRALLRPARPARSTSCPTARCTRAASARASSTASPTTATRSACRPSPAPCSTTRRYTTNPLVFCGCIGVAADRPLARRARSPATASSCSAGAPGATASAGRRSPAPRWTPPPARSPGPACRSATRSPRSC